jgi:hypothetical protein
MVVFKLIGKFLFNVLILLDEALNTILLGTPEDCLSSRIGKHSKGTVLESVVDFFFGKGHCAKCALTYDGSRDIWKW